MEPIPKAEFSIVTRTSAKAWLPERIAAAGPEVTESYIDFFTATIRNRNTRQSNGATYAFASAGHECYFTGKFWLISNRHNTLSIFYS